MQGSCRLGGCTWYIRKEVVERTCTLAVLGCTRTLIFFPTPCLLPYLFLMFMFVSVLFGAGDKTGNDRGSIGHSLRWFKFVMAIEINSLTELWQACHGLSSGFLPSPVWSPVHSPFLMDWAFRRSASSRLEGVVEKRMLVPFLFLTRVASASGCQVFSALCYTHLCVLPPVAPSCIL